VASLWGPHYQFVVLQVIYYLKLHYIEYTLQDIFHAEQRVIRTMNKQHVDYAKAVNELKAVFGRLLTHQMATEDDLARELWSWADKWETPTTSAFYTTVGQIQLAGNILPTHGSKLRF
jgi:hypothetical protein